VPALGLVGDPLPIAPDAVVSALAAGFIPVVAPLATHPELGVLNVNADEAAAALAVGLEAERILFVTDVPGVLVDGDLVAALPVDDADRMLGAGAFEGGIVPKLNAAVRAARRGVRAEIGETTVLG
jgi:acetylglutamate kinase